MCCATHIMHTHAHAHTHTHTYRDLSDESPNRVTAREETSLKTKHTGARTRRFSLPRLHTSPDPTSSSEISLLDGPNFPPLRNVGVTSPYASSSTTSLVEVKVKKNAKKSSRRRQK